MKKTPNHQKKTITKERNKNATVQISTKKNQQTCEKKTDQKTNAVGQTIEKTYATTNISQIDHVPSKSNNVCFVLFKFNCVCLKNRSCSFQIYSLSDCCFRFQHVVSFFGLFVCVFYMFLHFCRVMLDVASEIVVCKMLCSFHLAPTL